jgi:hypothetical protein
VSCFKSSGLNRNCARTQSFWALAQIRLSKVESGHDSRESCLSLDPAIPAREELYFVFQRRRGFRWQTGKRMRAMMVTNTVVPSGTVSRFASLEARKRRVPRTSSYVPASPSESGRNRIGWRTPCCLMLSASSASFASSRSVADWFWTRGFVLAEYPEWMKPQAELLSSHSQFVRQYSSE